MYGLQSRPIAFAPNVTPGTFVEPENISWADLAAPTTVLFPPSEKPAQPATRKRLPPGKRPSQGYIPRPPNAFMLFRADFVKQRHVPGSIETNHGSLSKIIGNSTHFDHSLFGIDSFDGQATAGVNCRWTKSAIGNSAQRKRNNNTKSGIQITASALFITKIRKIVPREPAVDLERRISRCKPRKRNCAAMPWPLCY